jgi:hypothetical protein
MLQLLSVLPLRRSIGDLIWNEAKPARVCFMTDSQQPAVAMLPAQSGNAPPSWDAVWSQPLLQYRPRLHWVLNWYTWYKWCSIGTTW